MRDELVELQEKLNGVYDLTDTVDCQSVIRMLLMDIEREKLRTGNIQDKLREFAFLVLRSKGCELDVKVSAQKVLSQCVGQIKQDVVVDSVKT